MAEPESGDRRVLLLQALRAVEDMKAKLRAVEEAHNEPIAIVGMACRFPGGADTPDKFWDLLAAGREVVSEIPRERWGGMDVPPSAAVWRAGLVEGIDQFDPKFFGISAREAASMDPQQRMVLEVAWEALEHAGQNPQALAGSDTGVFVGITGRDYAELVKAAGQNVLDVYTATGNASNAAAGRLSFVLGLQGPSVSIDTACSSSLVALHLACQSLRTRECRIAIASGVNAVLTPDPFICFQNWGMMAPDGRCKTFDQAADGFVRAEGCGTVVLKRLSDAERDRDRMLAVVRGTAVNQDGRSSGLTVPNGIAQEAVIRQALAMAGVEGRAIDYVEAHGTGTSLGDPIEAHALAAVLGPDRAVSAPLFLGSVKTNLGHLESAAGMAGLIKTVLALQREEIPRHLHFHQLSSSIDWGGAPIRVASEARPWRRGERPRLAGISSFGFSGTNAHAIVGEAPAAPASPAVDARPGIFTLSARTPAALQQLAARTAAAITGSNLDLHDLCFTAHDGRALFPERAAIVAASAGELAGALRALADGSTPAAPFARARADRARPKLAFLFTGQGSQYAGMGRELYETEAVFREAIDRCEALLAAELDVPLTSVLWGGASDRLDDTTLTQPAIFALEWALAALWRSWGVEPSVVLGHSVGEYVAACVAGVYSLADGLKLIAERSRLMGSLPHGAGAMAAVEAPVALVEPIVAKAGDRLSIAAVNGPASTVISGDRDAVATAIDALTASGYGVDRLRVSHAFHSPLMAPIEERFTAAVAGVAKSPPGVTLISSVTGAVASAVELSDPAYWRRQVRDRVAFHAALQTLAGQGCAAWIEIGPGTTLLGLARGSLTGDPPALVPTLRKGKSDAAQTASGLASLFARGVAINWPAYDAGRDRRRATLPSYPFERQRYWVDARQGAQPAAAAPAGTHPLVGRLVDLAGSPDRLIWQRDVSIDSIPWVVDHRVQGRVVMPATAYIEMAVTAARRAFGEDHPITVSRFEFKKPLFMSGDERHTIQVTLHRAAATSGRVEIHSRAAGEWTLHAIASVAVAEAPAPIGEAAVLDGARHVDGDVLYERFQGLGNDWGPSFRLVASADLGASDATATVVVPADLAAEMPRYLFHPAVADACGHALAAIRAFDETDGENARAMVGEAIGDVTIYQPARATRLICRARLRPSHDPSIVDGDVSVFDEDGALVSVLHGARLRYLDAERATAARGVDSWFYRVAWRPLAATPVDLSRPDWILVGGPEALVQPAAAAMRELGAHCRVVTTLDTDAFSSGQPAPATGIVYLDGLSAHHPSKGETWAESSGAMGLIRAAQQVARLTADHDVRLFHVTRGAQAAENRISPQAIWQAPQLGLGRTLAVEAGEYWGGLVDLDPVASDAENGRALAAYLLSHRDDDQVAWRAGRWLAARLERQNVAPTPSPHFRADASYVITGGTGGLGLEIARWLVARGARHLVLLARTPLPPAETWQPTSDNRAVRAIQELQGAGVVVHTGSVDVSDPAQVAEFFERRATDGMPAVRGVVHAAGVLEHAAIDELDGDRLERLLKPKAAAWVLDQQFAAADLDFFVLFSSASAVLGSPRLGAYAAGNAFLDALAVMRAGEGRPALSVNWGVWGEAGMASQFAAPTVQSHADRGMGQMKTAEGLEALERLIARSDPSIAVLPIEWESWSRLFPAYMATPFFSDVRSRKAASAAGSEPSLVAQLVAIPESDRAAALAQALAALLGAVAGFAPEELEHDRPVTDYGLDSLMALEFKNRIQAAVAVAPGIVELLEGPSIAELAQRLAPRLAAAPAAVVEGDEALLARVHTLSDDDVDAELRRLLAENP